MLALSLIIDNFVDTYCQHLVCSLAYNFLHLLSSVRCTLPSYSFPRIISEFFFAALIFFFALKKAPAFFHIIFFVFLFTDIIFWLAIISTFVSKPIFDVNVLFIKFSPFISVTAEF